MDTYCVYFPLVLNHAPTLHATSVSLIKPLAGSKLVYRAGQDLSGMSISILQAKRSVIFTPLDQKHGPLLLRCERELGVETGRWLGRVSAC